MREQQFLDLDWKLQGHNPFHHSLHKEQTKNKLLEPVNKFKIILKCL